MRVSNAIRKKIQDLIKANDPSSPRYGRIVQWSGSPSHFGIGINGREVMALGDDPEVYKDPLYKPERSSASLRKHKYITEPTFSPRQVVERLAWSLVVFDQEEWQYHLTAWNCEHWARLVAENTPCSYQVAAWCIPNWLPFAGTPFNGGWCHEAKAEFNSVLGKNARHLLRPDFSYKGAFEGILDIRMPREVHVK